MSEGPATTGSSPPPDRPGEARGGQTLRGFLWMGLGTGGQAVVQLLVLMALARLLAPEEFGLVSAALVVVGVTAIFSQFGAGPAIVQRPELRPAHLTTGFALSQLLGLACAGVLWIGAPLVGAFFRRREELAPVVRVLALAFPLQSCGIVAESLLQRELRFRRLAVVELTAFTLGFGAVGVTLAFLRYGVWALVGAQLAQAVLRTGLMLAARPHPIALRIERRALGELLYFGGGFTVARLTNYLAVQADQIVIGRWLGPVALGVYGRAYQLMAAPANLFGQVLDRVLFPTMALEQGRPDRLAAHYRRGVALVALVALPASALVCVLAPEIIRVLLGPDWSAVVVPLQYLTAGMLFRTSYKISDSLARATGSVYRRAWRQGGYAVLVFGGAFVGQYWGLAGVSCGVVLALAGNFLLMAHLSLCLVPLSWRSFWAAHVPGLALAALVGVPVWATAAVCRSWGLPPLVVLLACLPVALPALLLVRGRPQLFLGEDGQWVVRRIAASRAARAARTARAPLARGVVS